MELFGFSSEAVAALDIGVAEVLVLQLSKVQKKLQIDGYALIPIENGNTTAAIEGAMLKARLNAKKICVAINNTKVINRTMKLPKELKPHEIVYEIELELDRHFPYLLEQVAFDYVISKPSSNSEELEVLLCIAKLQDITAITNIVNAAGLICVAVDVDVEATMRAVANLIPEISENFAIYEIWPGKIVLIIIKKMRIIYVREHKLNDLHASMNSIIYQLYYDFSLTNQTINIEEIYFVGSDINMHELANELAHKIQITTFILDISKNIELLPGFSKNINPTINFLQCYGLALRYVN